MSWPLVAIGEFCDLKNGYAFKSDDYIDKSNTLNCRMSNIRPGGYFDLKYSPKYLPDEYVEKYSDFLLKDGDVVIAMTDLASSPKILGVPTVVKTNGKNVLLNQRVGKLTIENKSVIHLPYLQLALNYPKVREVYKRFAGGGLQINAGKADILSVKIPLPPLNEQKRIAAILDKADSLRRKRQQAIQLADQFLRSVFLDLFGDPVTNPKGWEIKEINEVCTDIVDCVNRTAKTVDYVTPYKMIRTTNVRNYCINLDGARYVDKDVYEKWVRRLKPEIGDLVFTREAPAGEAGIIDTDDEVFLGQRTMHFRPNYHHMDSVFFLYELMGGGIKQQVKKQSAGSTVTHLSVPECKKFKIRVPPVELQHKFAQIRNKIIKSNKNIQESFCSSNDLFGSLSQKAFAGEL